MRFVTDTHCLIWYFRQAPQLSPLTRRLFEQRESRQIVIPTIVMAEALYISRKIPDLPYERAFTFLEEEERFEITPLTAGIVRKAFPLVGLEMHDALIAATALYLEIPLMTADHDIMQSGLVHTLNP